MDPLTLSAIIGGGAALAGGGIDLASTGSMNRASRKWAVEQWNRQNAYNAPKAQMQRFKEAGLNPNLIYGRGDSGQAGPAPTPEFKSPEVGRYVSQAGAVSASAIYDMELKKAQSDNLRAQNEVIKQEAALKAVQIADIATGTQRKKFDLDFETEMRTISADARKAALHNLKVETDVMQARNLREAVSLASNVNEASERVKTMQLGRDFTALDMKRLSENISLLKQQGVLNDLDIALRRAGVQPNDELWQRMLVRVFEKLANSSPEKVMQSIDDGRRKGGEYLDKSVGYQWRLLPPGLLQLMFNK